MFSFFLFYAMRDLMILGYDVTRDDLIYQQLLPTTFIPLVALSTLRSTCIPASRKMPLRGSIKHALAASEPQKHITNISTALFHLNFYRLHLLYFILVIIVSSVILYGSSTSSFQIAYIDAIYLCTSAMCNIGLASINLSSLTGFQQSILFVLMLMGDLTIVTISVVVVRRYYFSKKIRKLLQESQASRQVAEDIEQRQLVGKERGSEGSRSKHQASKSRDPSPSRRKHLPAHQKGYGAFPAPWNSRRVKGFFGRLTGRKMSDFAGQHHYLSFQPTLDYKVYFSFTSGSGSRCSQ